ncbi:MAG: TlpA family protein disulfide reductase [Terriglobales bacterium]
MKLVIPRLSGPLSRRFTVRLFVGVAAVALDLVLVVTCVLAARQNSALRSQLARAVDIIGPPLHTASPPLTGEDEGGAELSVNFRGGKRPTVIFTFKKDCPYRAPYWREIRKLRAEVPQKLRLVCVDTSEVLPPGFLEAHGAGNALLLHRLGSAAALAYQARMLPQVEVIDRDGRAQWSHSGELAAEQAAVFQSLVLKDIQPEK